MGGESHILVQIVEGQKTQVSILEVNERKVMAGRTRLPTYREVYFKLCLTTRHTTRYYLTFPSLQLAKDLIIAPLLIDRSPPRWHTFAFSPQIRRVELGNIFYKPSVLVESGHKIG